MARGWLHHIDITVSDMARSTEFYDRVLLLMGFQWLPDSPEGPIWCGAMIEVGLQHAHSEAPRQHDRYTPGLHHLAFGAPDRRAVDRLHEELQHLGVRILDPPAQYDEYAPGYYAVFFSDPDGIKLEYVFTPQWPV
jgi:glyoxylase I family protein